MTEKEIVSEQPTQTDFLKEAFIKAVEAYILYRKHGGEALFIKDATDAFPQSVKNKIADLGEVKMKIVDGDLEKFHLDDPNFNLQLCLSKVCKTIPWLKVELWIHPEWTDLIVSIKKSQKP